MSARARGVAALVLVFAATSVRVATAQEQAAPAPTATVPRATNCPAHGVRLEEVGTISLGTDLGELPFVVDAIARVGSNGAVNRVDVLSPGNPRLLGIAKRGVQTSMFRPAETACVAYPSTILLRITLAPRSSVRAADVPPELGSTACDREAEIVDVFPVEDWPTMGTRKTSVLGRIAVRFAGGGVVDVSVAQSTGEPELDAVLVAAAKRAGYRTPRAHCEALDATTIFTFAMR